MPWSAKCAQPNRRCSNEPEASRRVWVLRQGGAGAERTLQSDGGVSVRHRAGGSRAADAAACSQGGQARPGPLPGELFLHGSRAEAKGRPLMKVSDIQIDDLLRKYRLRKYSLQLSDKRFSCYGIAQVQETIAALLE